MKTATASPEVRFILHRYNPRRRARGVEAAQVQVLEDETAVDLLWMSLKDVKENQKMYPDDQGLLDAVEAYKRNKEYVAP